MDVENLEDVELDDDKVLEPIAKYLAKYYLESKEDPPRKSTTGTRTRRKQKTVVQKRAEKAQALLRVCTYLDPRYKGRLPEPEVEKARISILGKISSFYDMKISLPLLNSLHCRG